MTIVRCLFLMLSAICFYGSDALAADFAAPFASHNFFTHELKPSPDAFKTAKSTWLPDSFEDLGLSGRHNTKYDFNQNNCSGYPLTTCPSNGKCTKCPVGARWKLDSCNTGYTKTGDTCTKNAVFCETNATTYKNKIPDDYFCAKVTNNPQCSNSSLTNCDKCYTSCYKINCSGYPLDCNSINKAALHIATTEICSNCKSSLSNCLKAYCKIIKCADGYKMNADGTACVEKNDICPNGYYKSCETGTQGEPQYTEKGTACYQCKPKTCTADTCSEYTLDACPAKGICSTCSVKNNDCTTGATKYKLDSCSAGYTKSGNSCTQDSYCSLGICEQAFCPIEKETQEGFCRKNYGLTGTFYPYWDETNKVTCNKSAAEGQGLVAAPINFDTYNFNYYLNQKKKLGSSEIKDTYPGTNKTVKEHCMNRTCNLSYYKINAESHLGIKLQYSLKEGDNSGYIYLEESSDNLTNINLNGEYIISSPLTTQYCAHKNCATGTTGINPCRQFLTSLTTGNKGIYPSSSLNTNAAGAFISINIATDKVILNNQTTLFNTQISADEITINGTVNLIYSKLQANKINFGKDAVIIVNSGLPSNITPIIDAETVNYNLNNTQNQNVFIHYIVTSGYNDNSLKVYNNNVLVSFSTKDLDSLLKNDNSCKYNSNNYYLTLEQNRNNNGLSTGLPDSSTISGKNENLTQFTGKAKAFYAYAPVKILGNTESGAVFTDLIIREPVNITSLKASDLFEHVIYNGFPNDLQTVSINFTSNEKENNLKQKFKNNTYTTAYDLTGGIGYCITGATDAQEDNRKLLVTFNISDKLEHDCSNYNLAQKITEKTYSSPDGEINEMDYLFTPYPFKDYAGNTCYLYEKKNTDCGMTYPPEGVIDILDYLSSNENDYYSMGQDSFLDEYTLYANNSNYAFDLKDKSLLNDACNKFLEFNKRSFPEATIVYSRTKTWYDEYDKLGTGKIETNVPRICGFCSIQVE